MHGGAVINNIADDTAGGIYCDNDGTFEITGATISGNLAENDGGGFKGPMRLREALVQSRNLVSVRLLDSIGVDFARKYISQFGFQEAELPPNLSMSLGTASLTPLSVARGYAVFANGGSRVDTWIIDKVTDRDGNVLFQEHPPTACRSCGSVGGSATPASQVVDGFNFGSAAPPPRP
jgi:penicillin-binding protein 1A